MKLGNYPSSLQQCAYVAFCSHEHAMDVSSPLFLKNKGSYLNWDLFPEKNGALFTLMWPKNAELFCTELSLATLFKSEQSFYKPIFRVDD